MTMAFRWLGRTGTAVVLLGAASGCDSKPAESGAATTATVSASATASVTEAPSSSAPASPPPADLDVAALQKALACGGNAKSGPCLVLAGFAACKGWSAEAPSGDG